MYGFARFRPSARPFRAKPIRNTAKKGFQEALPLGAHYPLHLLAAPSCQIRNRVGDRVSRKRFPQSTVT